MSGDDELLRRLRDHGRRLEREAEGIDARLPAAPRSHPRRVPALVGALLAAVVVATVIAIAVGSHDHKHEAITVTPSTTSTTVAAAPLVYGTLPPRYGAAMAYDATRRQVVLFGGTSKQSLNDTWLWDGQRWGEAHPAVAPSPRRDAAMAYDPATKEVLLFGGTKDVFRGKPIAHRDTWAWDGTNWTELHPRHAPPGGFEPATGFAMSYDPRSRSMLLMALPSSHPNLSAQGETGDTDFGTWQWTGSDWRELNTRTAPVFVILASLAYDEPRLTTLPHGAGLLFYSWAGFTGTCPSGPCGPGPDPTGTRDAQTWTWDGTRWTRQHPRRAPVDGLLVATPGSNAEPTVFTPDGATWRWTGSDWDRAAPNGAAPHQLEGTAVYDDAHRDVVAYAGNFYGPGNTPYDTWTWNGTWTKRSPPAPPTNTATVPPAKCTATQLDTHAGWQAVEGTRPAFVTLHNSGAPCLLDVRGATASLYAGGAALPLERQPAGPGRDLTPRALPNDGSAVVIVYWSNWCKPPPGQVSGTLTLPGLAATGTLAFNGPDPSSVPRCDAPSSPSGIEFLGFSAG